MPYMINPKKGIDLMNNKSIINRILFAVKIFHYLRGYSSMSLEYPKLNTWTEANLGKFHILLLYEGLFLLMKVSSLFLLYEDLPVGLLIPSLRRSSYGI
jgi:hypothetical protein